jgi:hypothetical protein
VDGQRSQPVSDLSGSDLTVFFERHAPAVSTHFYGLGWNVPYDDQVRLQLGHSGAFNLGAQSSGRPVWLENSTDHRHQLWSSA